MIRDIEDFRALDPFFRIIEQGLQGLADGDHFFDLLADGRPGSPFAPPRGTARAGSLDRRQNQPPPLARR